MWPQIKPGVEEVIRKCPDDFWPEDVYASLQRGGSTLFLVEDGFMVVEIVNDAFSTKKTLYVWILYWLKAEENQDLLYEHLDRLAKQAGCCRIHFKSPRMGWMKKAKGFKLKLITWEREIG